MDKIRALGLDKNTYVFWTTDNGAWQDVYPDAGYTPFRGTKGTDARRRQPRSGHRMDARQDQGRIEEFTTSSAGWISWPRSPHLPACKLPENDREGKPMIFDSFDMSPVLFGTGKSQRRSWFYFTENELLRVRCGSNNYKFVFNLRGDDGASTGGLAVDTNLGWKGAEKYVATVPQIFDLWQDPQERYDMFMNNFTERTWMAVVMGQELKQDHGYLRQVSSA